MWRGLEACRVETRLDARRFESSPLERRDESRRGRHECPRHENQVVADTHGRRIYDAGRTSNRSYSALNSQPSRAIRDIRYIQTISVMLVATLW